MTVYGKTVTIHATDTLFDPTVEHKLPMVSVTPSPETCLVGLWGQTLDCTMKVDIIGFTHGGSMGDREPDKESALNVAAEALIQAVKTKLTSSAFIAGVACAFSITQIGPVVSEHMELEEPIAYVSIPLTVQYLDDYAA